MPSESEPQRRLMGMALAEKRGRKTGSKQARKIARGMSEGQLHDFAKGNKRTKRGARRSYRK